MVACLFVFAFGHTRNRRATMLMPFFKALKDARVKEWSNVVNCMNDVKKGKGKKERASMAGSMVKTHRHFTPFSLAFLPFSSLSLCPFLSPLFILRPPPPQANKTECGKYKTTLSLSFFSLLYIHYTLPSLILTTYLYIRRFVPRTIPTSTLL